MTVIGRALIAFGAVAAFGSAGHAQEPVSFPTADDGVVFADVYGSGPHGVVLAHGGRFDKSSWEPQARVLADAGFRVVALDFRGRGDSRAGRAGGDALPLDVLAAVRFLRETGAERVAVVGASLGGWAAAQAVVQSRPGEIDDVVLLAHSPVDRPERLTGRKLFVVARDDTTGAGVRRLDAIRVQYERAPGPKRLLALEGSAHAQLLFRTDQAERLMREILRFLSKPAGGPGRSVPWSHAAAGAGARPAGLVRVPRRQAGDRCLPGVDGAGAKARAAPEAARA